MKLKNIPLQEAKAKTGPEFRKTLWAFNDAVWDLTPAVMKLAGDNDDMVLRNKMVAAAKAIGALTSYIDKKYDWD